MHLPREDKELKQNKNENYLEKKTEETRSVEGKGVNEIADAE